ncbi:MAG: gliding motility lipoprotein GldD [Paludibacteraceae bacterium]|nr:gliding motility lipoprotein GldD [Paludibacteraceae bacterium]
MKYFLTLVFASLLFVSCSNDTPKPYAYFRIDLPPHEYRTFDSIYPPCSFEVPASAQVINRKARDGKSEWIDIVYPSLNGRIYCNYSSINANFRALSEDSRNLVYKHTVRADAIIEHPFENPEMKVYGILYEITGNAASPIQFIVTDSVHHFLRGSLYFNNTPNADSIAPVSAYVEDDIRHLVESVIWK